MSDMMTIRIRMIILAILLFGVIYIIRRICKKDLELKYAIIWFALGIGLILVVIIPGLLEGLAALMGIYDVTNMVFFIGFLFSILLIFNLTMSLSRSSDRIRKLTQANALDAYENKRIRNEIEQMKKK